MRKVTCATLQPGNTPFACVLLNKIPSGKDGQKSQTQKRRSVKSIGEQGRIDKDGIVHASNLAGAAKCSSSSLSNRRITLLLELETVKAWKIQC